MTVGEFEDILREYSTYEKILRDRVKVYTGWHCIFIPDIKQYPELSTAVSQFLADNGNLETERFMQALKCRISAFVEQALTTNQVYVFENVMFQQILNELMRKMCCDKQQMVEHVLEVEQILLPLNPLIFYLYPDNLKTQINKIALERVSDNYELYPDWIDWMVEYVQNSEYGRLRNVTNRDGLMTYFEERMSLEEQCFKQSLSNKDKILIDHMNYDEINEYIYKKCNL